MSLWIVFTGWQGNGADGVIVEASSEAEAVQAAQLALVVESEKDLAEELARWPGRPSSHSEHIAEQLADYRDGSSLHAEPIELPYHGSFG